jgi:hypothetical protein
MSKVGLVLIILIIIGAVAFFVIKKLGEVKVFEFIRSIKFSKDQFLETNYNIFSLTSLSNDYVYRAEIKNNFDENITLYFNSKLIIEESEKSKFEISSYSFSDFLESKKQKTYDIRFQNIFDNSKISGLNFCDQESKKWYEIFRTDPECAKDKPCNNGVCLEDCKCYVLSNEKVFINNENRNLYCIGKVYIENEMEYSSKIKGIIEVQNFDEESRKKLQINAPFEVYALISPTPYNNLLPLEMSFEFRFEPSYKGEKLRIKRVNVTLLDSYIEVSSFFWKRIERVEPQVCVFELEKEIEGKIYSKLFDKYCTFQPPKIKIEEKNEIEILNTSEEAKKIVENICKDKNIEECSKELKDKYYTICSFYQNLEICKSSEYRLNSYKFLIEIEFEKLKMDTINIKDIRFC